MIERRAGEMTTLDTRGESHEKVDKQIRYKQIIEIMGIMESYGQPTTAKEIAATMNVKGLIPSSERNFTAPRLTELCKMGKVEPVGKERCRFTGRMVTVYKLRED